MKIVVGLLIAIVAIGEPTNALLGAKLALLGALTGGGGGGGDGGILGGGLLGGGKGGYGSGGYNGGYNQGYYGGPARPPVYTSGYGYSSPSYGVNYGGGYQSGGDQVVKIIKVIVPQQQRYSSGYEGSGWQSSWTPVSARAPIEPTTSYVTTQAIQGPTYAPVPISQSWQAQVPQTVQVSQPVPVQIPQPVQIAAPTQTVQYTQQPYTVPLQPPPPPRTTYTIRPSNTVQVPIQVPAQQPQPQPLPHPIQISQPVPQGIPQNIQSSVKTVRVIVDDSPSWNSIGYGGTPSQTYGPPPQVSTSSSGWGQNGVALTGNSGWASNGAGNWNNGYKTGGIWEKLGC